MTGKVVATIDIGGVLEEAVEDPSVNRVYVNVDYSVLNATKGSTRDARCAGK